MFSRVAIVNRGEPAMRLIRAVRELNAEHDAGIRTVALHTAAEAGAMFVRQADEAVRIGPPSGTPTDNEAGNPYLDHGELRRALREAGADAVWPGWGFVAEQPDFVDLCADLGIVFIGPDAHVMRSLGDKIGAKRLAERSGIPMAAWSEGPVDTLDEARRLGKAIGYPLVIKATAGGGGRGIRTVEGEPELDEAFERARDEARRSFGDPTVFMERLLRGARHIEVQIAADDAGTVWALGVRDCSIQRRKQKVIEESSSSALTGEQDRRLRVAATELARAAGYRNVGTVEFLYQPAEDAFAFLEVNPRLQVEHPVTELTTGLDLVKLQLQLAAGGRLEGEPPAVAGHAFEARLNAEDPERGFAPAPGTIELLTLPSGPGVRVDTGVDEGDVIPPEYDSMIAKVMAWGRDRGEARARLHRALAETTVMVRGGTTNKGFLLDLLQRPEVRSGNVHTGWLDDRSAALPARHAEVGLLVAAVNAYDAEAARERGRFYESAARGRPHARDETGHVAELRHGGHGYRLGVSQVGPQRYRVEVDGQRLDVALERPRRFEARVGVGGATFRVVSMLDGLDQLIEVDGAQHRFSLDEGGVVRAPAPAMVVAISVAVGDTVDAGASLAVLESMKMELPVPAPFHGRVAEVLVARNVQVAAGAPLLRVEPIESTAGGGDAAPAADRLRCDELVGSDVAADDRDRALGHLEVLRLLMLGFDVGASDARHVADQYTELRRHLPADDPVLLRAELETLEIFADLCELSRNRRAGQQEGEETRSPREHLHAFLRSLDVDAEGLPAGFQHKLRRALSHYDVADLDRTPALEHATYRIFRAQQRAAEQVPAVLAVLDRRLDAETLPTALAEQLRETLGRVITATQLRYPPVGELARSVRYRCFDAPVLQRGRHEVFAAMRSDLAYLAAHPETPDHEERITRLVDCPQPLVRLLADHAGERDIEPYEPMLEVLTRRYYRAWPLRDCRSFSFEKLQFVTAERRHEGRTTHVVTTLTAAAALRSAAAAAATVVEQLTDRGAVLVDIYVWTDQPDGDPDALSARLADDLDAAGFPPATQRVTVVVAGRDPAGRGIAEAPVGHFTYHPHADGFVEDRISRALHPMIAERLALWRLTNFDIERLPSAEDTYLFRCVARDNPEDERLIALAEVRDVTPARDASGRVTAVPELEQMLSACLDGLRRAQAGRPPHRRLYWNRVLLYVWPEVEAPVEQLLEVARGLAPLTEGLGLEEVAAQGWLRQPDGEPLERVVHMSSQPGTGLTVRMTGPPAKPLEPLDEYTQKVLKCRRRGQVYPYELMGPLTRPRGGATEDGSFTEYDLDDDGRLVPVSRSYGRNSAGIVVGVLRTPTERHPEGIMRVALFGDPTKALGAIAEPECRRVVAALDLATELGVPVDWFALSAGARIAMDSGTENMDWVARVLRRLIEFTQGGGECNVVVAGINVGAQPYWNAEATMLMHTSGILVMTPDSAMVLTGKQSLDYSGGVSAEDNVGIGGYERVMGRNGQGQYWVPDLTAACELLAVHHEHGYVAPGERFGRQAVTTDPVERDVRDTPHDVEGCDFAHVGDIFSEQTNPGRKKPFDIRVLMRAIVDADHPSPERWEQMGDADTAVVFDAYLGGHPVTLLGIESRPLPRFGFLPADGPHQWTAGTLFPLSSKKVARALNAASGRRPVVVVANLSGFDGSPESLRRLQLEYGAEIGRAVVNFDGPVVFCVVSRYHGGAFVVFSGALNENLEIVAVEGSFASVIGGAPAAAVVFAGEVADRARRDPRVTELEQRVEQAGEGQRAALRAELTEVHAAVHAEKLGEMAAEFDAVHSVERARQMGSVHRIIPADRLRPFLVDAVERGIHRTVVSR